MTISACRDVDPRLLVMIGFGTMVLSIIVYIFVAVAIQPPIYAAPCFNDGQSVRLFTVNVNGTIEETITESIMCKACLGLKDLKGTVTCAIYSNSDICVMAKCIDVSGFIVFIVGFIGFCIVISGLMVKVFGVVDDTKKNSVRLAAGSLAEAAEKSSCPRMNSLDDLKSDADV